MHDDDNKNNNNGADANHNKYLRFPQIISAFKKKYNN